MHTIKSISFNMKGGGRMALSPNGACQVGRYLKFTSTLIPNFRRPAPLPLFFRDHLTKSYFSDRRVCHNLQRLFPSDKTQLHLHTSCQRHRCSRRHHLPLLLVVVKCWLPNMPSKCGSKRCAKKRPQNKERRGNRSKKLSRKQEKRNCVPLTNGWNKRSS